MKRKMGSNLGWLGDKQCTQQIGLSHAPTLVVRGEYPLMSLSL